MARPRTHDEGTRDELVDAAGDLLRREGPGAVTVRRLAAQVDASTTVIYSLFGSKDGIVAAMFRDGFTNLDHHLAAAVRPDQSSLERLAALGLAYRDAARARPHLYDVMFACPFPDFHPSPEDDEFALGTLQVLRDAVTGAVDEGALVGDVETITYGLWGLVHGLASLEAGAPDSMDASIEWFDAMWEANLDALIAGHRPA